jgi:hypothetical protein
MILSDEDIKNIIAIAAPLLGFVGTYLLYRGNFLQRGTYAKQLHIIEVATKRTEYWTEYLKTVELADSVESEKYIQAKDKVNEALARIRNEADAEMKRLSWNRQITRLLRKQEHSLTVVKRSFDWYSSIVMWLFSTFIGLFLLALFVHEVYRGRVETVGRLKMGVLGCLAAAGVILGGWFRREALKVRYPEPPAPLIDRI